MKGIAAAWNDSLSFSAISALVLIPMRWSVLSVLSPANKPTLDTPENFGVWAITLHDSCENIDMLSRIDSLRLLKQCVCNRALSKFTDPNIVLDRHLL